MDRPGDIRAAAEEALRREREEHEEAARVVSRERAERVERVEREGWAALEESGLREWFPDAEWELYDHEENSDYYFGDGRWVFCSGRPAATDPDWAGVPCFLLGGSLGEVVLAFHAYNSTSYAYYWTGSVVRSVADVGRALERWEREPPTKNWGKGRNE